MQAKSSELISPQQVDISLAKRIRWLLDHFRLQQKDLAQLMGVDVDRVKSLVLNRAKALRRDEIDRLVAGLGVRESWLVDNAGAPLREGSEVNLAAAGTGGFLLAAMKAVDAHRAGHVAQEPAAYDLALPPNAALLVQCVRAVEAELQARGRKLESAKLLRLYWAVFELSMQGGRVNPASIGPLIELAAA